MSKFQKFAASTVCSWSDDVCWSASFEGKIYDSISWSQSFAFSLTL